ncbi:MAG TPA: pentapeptide repeat-containing protein, partial [Candidatus Cloacimonadota bacterium]|nr:pentapeptide repeat-containing protein [Candidatus Cloacimonadota bacterium]
MEYTKEELDEMLESHRKWLIGEPNGTRFVAKENADLSSGYFCRAELRDAYLVGANFTYANLTYANLRNADLSNSYLAGANLHNADLTHASLIGADLLGTHLTGANLTYTNLTGAKNLIKASDFMRLNFNQDKQGYYVYKQISHILRKRDHCKIDEGCYMEQVVNRLPTIAWDNDHFGVTFGVKEYCMKKHENLLKENKHYTNYGSSVWLCLIQW